ncbi:MAG: bifunctional oligoribonuclease/PAP phosphatase NrnA [Desulfobacterales bacterium]|nr:bifunctional oligoribonuclease/PAP phosphatase NrnA [Desulfobacterales bacterium]MDX2508678.1 bifunctional oligoribonuclease/PAP phosphatase NrnA [Desulfobacterales bacterium]
MDRIINQLLSSNHVLLASHTNPDGDAVGSTIAMGLLLAAIDKKITLYNESSIPVVYRFLPRVEMIENSINNANDFDTAIILDCSNLQRIGTAASMVNDIPTIINIDHHISNSQFGSFQLIDTSASSTAEIIYRLIKKMGVAIDKTIATSIYTGILTDTGSFRFSNTNQAAFAICQEMVEKGVDPSDVAQHVYGRYSIGRIKLLNLALDSIEIFHNGKLSIMTVTQEMLSKTGTRTEDIDGLINYARRIEDVKIAALIHEKQNGSHNLKGSGQFHVSLRSDGTVDVAAFATFFGGGGHATAAGFEAQSVLAEIKSGIANLAEKI